MEQNTNKTGERDNKGKANEFIPFYFSDLVKGVA